MVEWLFRDDSTFHISTGHVNRVSTGAQKRLSAFKVALDRVLGKEAIIPCSFLDTMWLTPIYIGGSQICRRHDSSLGRTGAGNLPSWMPRSSTHYTITEWDAWNKLFTITCLSAQDLENKCMNLKQIFILYIGTIALVLNLRYVLMQNSQVYL